MHPKIHISLSYIRRVQIAEDRFRFISLDPLTYVFASHVLLRFLPFSYSPVITVVSLIQLSPLVNSIHKKDTNHLLLTSAINIHIARSFVHLMAQRFIYLIYYLS